MTKVAISTGHSRLSVGAISIDGDHEWDLNVLLVNAITSIKSPAIEWLRPDKDYEDLPYPEHLVRTIRAINESDADLAIDVHHNSVSNHRVTGGMVIYWDTSRNGRLLAESIALAWKLGIGFNTYAFKRFWRNVGSDMRSDKPVPALAYLKRRLMFLSKTRMPAVILEPGYLSNKTDLNFVKEYRNEIARGVVHGIEAYLTGRQK